MAVDLPPGKWTALLIGPWWPEPSTTLRAAEQHWRQCCIEQEQYSRDLTNQWTTLSAHNQGHTADDLVARYYQGAKFHMNLAEKYRAKAEAFDSGADAIDYARSQLTDIANTGNKEIDEILASKRPPWEQAKEVFAVQVNCNARAANVSRTAVDKLVAASQKILNIEGVGGDARTWAREHGFNIDDAPPPCPITGDELRSSSIAPSHAAAVGGGGGHGGQLPDSDPHTPVPLEPAVRGLQGHGNQSPGGAPPVAPPLEPAVSGLQGHGNQLPGSAPSVPTGPTTIGVGGPAPGTSVASPSLPSAPVSPAASLGQGISPGLGQSITTGMATGQPAAAGTQSVSSGAINAMESGTAPPQTAPPLTAPPAVAASAVSSGAAFTAPDGPVDASHTSSATPVPPASAAAPVAPAVVTGTPWSAGAVGSGPAVPTGPLPAYGSDLRPPVVTTSAMPSVPTAPVSGAPVSPSAASSASAGGPLVSPVERSGPGTAAGQAGAGSSSMAAASALSAATGATAGVASSRAAEQQRLQRLVDSVARQEPRLSWAAGLRDDGTTTLLVTDLACGWIPPHVRLPAHVTLLEPTARRRDASVVDLLGAVVVAAAHDPNTHVAEPGPDAPVLSGDRPARSAAPGVDELGPTLVEAVRRRDGLPRIAQALAAPAARRTGVLQNEIDLLRGCIAESQRSVLTVYPHHDLVAVGDWMLLAAIEALIDEHEYLANYHMAWFAVISRLAGP